MLANSTEITSRVCRGSLCGEARKCDAVLEVDDVSALDQIGKIEHLFDLRGLRHGAAGEGARAGGGGENLVSETCPRGAILGSAAQDGRYAAPRASLQFVERAAAPDRFGSLISHRRGSRVRVSPRFGGMDN
jgi:hypothetical protein